MIQLNFGMNSVRFVIADKIVSNNDTQFTAKDFEVFSIVHITTAPYHTRSNGQAETFGDIFKQALKS